MSVRSGTEDREYQLDPDKTFKHLVLKIRFDSDIVMGRLDIRRKTVFV